MTDATPWSFELHDPLVRFRERPDRAGAVYVYWWNPDRGKAGVMDKIRWPVKVRRPDGRRDRALIRAAEDELERIQRALMGGTPPRHLRKRDEAKAATPSKADRETLTIEVGFRKYFDPKKGAYPVENRNVRDLKRFRTTIELVLEPDTPWAALDADAGPVLWRGLADHYPGETGFRSAERTVGLFYRAAKWLRDRKQIPIDAALEPDGWKAQMRREWGELGKSTATDDPRYAPDEMQLILSETEKADPRIALALDIGVELRPIQLRRIRRTDTALDHGGGWGLGQMTLRGKGQQLGAVIDIDPRLREHLAEAMGPGGYLADLEARYQRREIADYHLIAGRDGGQMSRRYFARLWDDYEAALGIEKEEGRGWYGLRHSMADWVDLVTTDESVKDNAGAWRQGSGTRRKNYRSLASEDPVLIHKTRLAVMSARNLVLGTAPETEALRQEVAQMIWTADEAHLEAAKRALRDPKLTPVLTPRREADGA